MIKKIIFIYLRLTHTKKHREKRKTRRERHCGVNYRMYLTSAKNLEHI